MPCVKWVKFTWMERYLLIQEHEWFWHPVTQIARCFTCGREHKVLPQRRNHGHTKECRYAALLRSTWKMAINERDAAKKKAETPP